MRNAIALLLLFSTTFLYAQDLPVNDEKEIEFTEVVTTPGFSSDQLYDNAVAWFNAQYKSDKNRKAYKDEGSISDNQNIKSSGFSGGVNYDITILIKDGKYKYSITHFSHKDYAKGKCSGGGLEKEEPLCRNGKMSAKEWEKIKAEVAAEVQNIIASMKAGMMAKTEKKSDDW